MEEPSVKKIGIFGGSFNPPHNGHLLLAERVCEELTLDKVLFVPAAIPPHKIGASDLAPDTDRMEMLLKAIAGNKYFDISTLELDREGVSYTVDTLRTMESSFPGAEFYFLMGADSLAEFHTWKDTDIICSIADLVVMPREHFLSQDIPSALRSHVRIVHAPVIEISSTEIRKRVHEGKPIRYYVPREVAEYIEENNLYK